MVDNSLFRQLSRYSYNAVHKRSPTKRSAGAGKRTKKMTCQRSSFSAIKSEIVPTTVNIQQAAPRVRDVFLPSILYTNCRSLNTWKLAELQSYAEIYKPGRCSDKIPGSKYQWVRMPADKIPRSKYRGQNTAVPNTAGHNTSAKIPVVIIQHWTKYHTGLL